MQKLNTTKGNPYYFGNKYPIESTRLRLLHATLMQIIQRLASCGKR